MYILQYFVVVQGDSKFIIQTYRLRMLAVQWWPLWYWCSGTRGLE